MTDTARNLNDIHADPSTPGRIAAYIGPLFTEQHIHSGIPLDEINLGIISVCVSVIGAKEPGDPQHDVELVAAAGESLSSWAGDYGFVVLPYGETD